MQVGGGSGCQSRSCVTKVCWGICFGAKVPFPPCAEKKCPPQPLSSWAVRCSQSLRPTVRVSFPPQSRPIEAATARRAALGLARAPCCRCKAARDSKFPPPRPGRELRPTRQIPAGHGACGHLRAWLVPRKRDAFRSVVLGFWLGIPRRAVSGAMISERPRNSLNPTSRLVIPRHQEQLSDIPIKHQAAWTDC